MSADDGCIKTSPSPIKNSMLTEKSPTVTKKSGSKTNLSRFLSNQPTNYQGNPSKAKKVASKSFQNRSISHFGGDFSLNRNPQKSPLNKLQKRQPLRASKSITNYSRTGIYQEDNMLEGFNDRKTLKKKNFSKAAEYSKNTILSKSFTGKKYPERRGFSFSHSIIYVIVFHKIMGIQRKIRFRSKKRFWPQPLDLQRKKITIQRCHRRIWNICKRAAKNWPTILYYP